MKWELTKWEVEKVGIDEVGIDKVGIDKVEIDEVGITRPKCKENCRLFEAMMPGAALPLAITKKVLMANDDDIKLN